MSKNVIDEIEAQLEAVKLRPQTVGLIVENERLAALCQYVRATEALIETWGPLDLAAMSPELQAARRELGLMGKEPPNAK